MTILSTVVNLVVMLVVMIVREVDICEFRQHVATTLVLAFDIRGLS